MGQVPDNKLIGLDWIGLDNSPHVSCTSVKLIRQSDYSVTTAIVSKICFCKFRWDEEVSLLKKFLFFF